MIHQQHKLAVIVPYRNRETQLNRFLKHMEKYLTNYTYQIFVIEQTDHMNIFHIRDESVELLTGKLYWVNNHVPHWLENLSDTDRINLIVDARLD